MTNVSNNPVEIFQAARFRYTLYTMTNLEILLVDDHEVVRLGMRALLERHAGLKVVGEAATQDEAVAAALDLRPQVVLMDIRLAGGSGIEACRLITEALPDTSVIMLTSFAEDDLLFAAIRAGASGYLLKQVGAGDLVRAIEMAGRGESMLDPTLTQRVFVELRQSLDKGESNLFQELTAQERQVLHLIARGKTNREIAAELYLSEGTVRNYVSSVLSKLGVANRAEAAAFAIQHHLDDHL